MSDPFVHLHVHSTYSFQDGYGQPEAYAKRAVELGQTALAVTDHGNISAHRKWFDACTRHGIKPILGLEAYVCDDASNKALRQAWHITLLAKNAEGYRNLIAICTDSWSRGFYYKPRTDWETLKRYSRGVVATSGCPGGKIGNGINKHGWQQSQVVEEMKRQASLFEPGNYYAELSPWQCGEGVAIAEAVYGAAKIEGLPMVLTMDAHYPRPEDAAAQDVLLCIQNNCLFSDPKRMKFSQQDFCLWSALDMAKKWAEIHGSRLPGTEEMLWNTRKIAEECDLKFPTATVLEFPYQGDKNELLWRMSEEALKAKGFLGRQNYYDRLKYEFDLVVSKNFTDYFLIVADMISWAKDNGILVGPARGSSCGSLMCYLLRITEIDPLKHNLMFERFIDVTRKDLPDIDVDFDAERRAEVKAYMASKYGEDRVASLATYSTFKGRLCLQDIGRVFADRIPSQAVEETKRLIIQRSSADSRAGYTIEDTFTNFDQASGWLKKYPELGLAKGLEGQVRQLGVHAAGVVISNAPISEFAAMYRTSKKESVISMDGDDAKSVGLLKIDVLGLTALTALKKVLELVKLNHGVSVDVNRIPLDDAAVYENFCRQNLQGIFQFEGGSTRQVCRQVAPDNFKELTAVNALSRPGPLHAGETTSYIERRHGREKIKSIHPMLDSVTSDTYGIVVYQEQVMAAVRDIGRFNWKDVSAIRTAISKKYGDEYFASKKAEFIKGAAENGISKAIADEVWLHICTHGSWSFNKSHSVAYSVLAYQMMWLKTHYAPEFYAGVIACEDNAEKQRRLLKEFTNSGGTLKPVCVNKSKFSVSSEKGGLRLGFEAVTGLGSKVANDIIRRQPYKSYIDFTKRSHCPASQADKLLRVGAFRDLEFDSVTEQHDLFGEHKSQRSDLDYRQPKEEDVRALCPLAVENKSALQWNAWVKKNVKGERWDIRDIDDITDREEVLVVGNTNPSTQYNLKNKMEEAASRGNVWQPKPEERHLTKEQYSFLNFDLEDQTDTIIIRVGYKSYPQFKEMLWAISTADVIGVRGYCNGTMRMVFAHNVANLTKLKQKIETKQPLTKLEQQFLSGESQRERPMGDNGWRPRKRTTGAI